MDKRIAKALAASTVVALPLLSACGASSAPEGTSAAPVASSAAAPSTGAAAATPSASTPSATPTSDPAQEKKAVEAASEKFVKTALTIGYPDKRFSQYTARLKPLMTKDGYRSLDSAKKDIEKSLTGLYDEHARSVAKLQGDVKVSGLSADSATTKITYQSVIQKQQGGGWTTLQTAKKETVTVQLLKTDGKWLVDDAI